MPSQVNICRDKITQISALGSDLILETNNRSMTFSVKYVSNPPTFYLDKAWMLNFT